MSPSSELLLSWCCGGMTIAGTTTSTLIHISVPLHLICHHLYASQGLHQQHPPQSFECATWWKNNQTSSEIRSNFTNALCKWPLLASLYNSISNIRSKTWQTTLKTKQNSVFATRLQTSQSAHKTINLLRWTKHHEKQEISFGYLQALGVKNNILVNGRMQKLKWSNYYHKNETESHQPYFRKVQ